MHLYFLDDSGTIRQQGNYSETHFVLGGIVIPEEQWHGLEKLFAQTCKKFNVQGEVKWRFFGQKLGREDDDNSISHLTLQERYELRRILLGSLAKINSIKIIATVVHLPTMYSTFNAAFMPLAEAIYSRAYKPLTERFQYYLQDLSRASGSIFRGIIVCDHRNPHQDKRLRNFHQDLLKSNIQTKSRYPNLIEHLFLSPSHHSIGLQFADLIVGAIFRFFEKGDDKWYKLIEGCFRRNPRSGDIGGYGLIRMPNDSWEEKDAESRDPLEPAIVTQSQRNSDYN